MRAGVYTRDGQSLPQAGPAPLVHIEDVASTLTFKRIYLHRHKNTRHKVHRLHVHQLHPEMKKKTFRFSICRWLVRSTCELKEIQPALNFSTLVLRVHAPAHNLSRPKLWMV